MLTVSDYRRAALNKMPLPLSNYVEKKAGLGKTFEGNFAAFEKYQLIPRVLQNIKKIDSTAHKKLVMLFTSNK